MNSHIPVNKDVYEVDSSEMHLLDGEGFADENDIAFKVYYFPMQNKSTLSAKTIAKGDTVTVKCAVLDGLAPYKYSVYYRTEGTDTWKTLQNESTNKTVTFTPAAAGNYEVRVKITDKKGNSSRKDMKLTVNPALTNTSKLGAATIKLGEKVKVRCFAKGGVGKYQYAAYYKKKSAANDTWYKIRVYGDNNIIMYKPQAAVTYLVPVDIKDEKGPTTCKTLTLKVTK